MRIASATVCIAIGAMFAAAQAQTAQQPAQKKSGDSSHSEGRTVSPKVEGQQQPQGPTGPLNTTTGGGAPAHSPQGQTPPGMQPAPEGSSKTIVEPKGSSR